MANRLENLGIAIASLGLASTAISTGVAIIAARTADNLNAQNHEAFYAGDMERADETTIQGRAMEALADSAGDLVLEIGIPTTAASGAILAVISIKNRRKFQK